MAAHAGGYDRSGGLAAGRLWTGGVATAVVAGLVALVGVLIATTVFDTNPVAPGWLLGDGSNADRSTRFAWTAAVAAILATGLLHLLLLTTPRPRLFFGWVVTLATVAAALAPFATGGETGPQLATCLLALVIGIVIGTLLSAVATAAQRQ